MTGNRSTNRLWTVWIALALVAPAFAGCVSPGGEETGTGAFYVKDAPEDDWEHVNVTFTSVRVHQGGDNGSGEWITVAENETGREIDLLAFSTEDARALLGTAELENGTYNQVLINVTEAHGVHKDSGEREKFELTQPQLRLTRAWQIDADETTHVIADITLSQSIVEQGNGEYRFNPVIGQVIVEQGGEPEDQPGEEASESEDTPDSTRTAEMTTYVKDAPTDELSEVWIEFDEVEAHWAGNGTENRTDNGTDEMGDNETEEESGAWITLYNETRSVDLLNFNQSDSKAFLGEADVPVGKYTQIRISVTDAWAHDNNDTRVNVTLASDTTRVVKPWNVSANQTTPQAVIDLDLDRSLVKQGGQDQGSDRARGDDNQTRDRAEWRLKPVIGKVDVNHVAVDPMVDQRDTEDATEPPEEQPPS